MAFQENGIAFQSTPILSLGIESVGIQDYREIQDERSSISMGRKWSQAGNEREASIDEVSRIRLQVSEGHEEENFDLLSLSSQSPSLPHLSTDMKKLSLLSPSSKVKSIDDIFYYLHSVLKSVVADYVGITDGVSECITKKIAIPDYMQTNIKELDLSIIPYLTSEELLQIIPKLKNTVSLKMPCKTDDTILRKIAVELKNLQKLDLSNCKLVTDEGMQNILEQCNKLQHLNLSRCVQLTDTTFRNIASYLPGLTFLNVERCMLKKEGLRAIADSCPQLVYLDIGNIDSIDKQDCIYVVQKLQNLKYIGLSKINGVNRKLLLLIVKRYPDLDGIDISINDLILQNDFTMFMKRASNLTLLNACKLNDSFGVSALQYHSNPNKLLYLNLEGNKHIKDKEIGDTLKNFSELKDLNLSSTQAGPYTIVTLSENCKNLQHLSMAESVIDDNDLVKIMTLSHLLYLDLQRCNISGNGLNGVEPGLPFLQTLRLSNTEFDDKGLINFTSKTPSIETLYIDETKINGSSLVIVAEKCEELRELFIGRNKQMVQDNLERSFPFFKKLRRLDMTMLRNVTFEGDQPLEQIPSALQELNISYTKVSDSGFMRLVEGLRSLRILNIGHTPITDSTVGVISTVCKDIQNIYMGSCHRVTDDGIRHLYDGLPLLDHVDITGCKNLSLAIQMEFGLFEALEDETNIYSGSDDDAVSNLASETSNTVTEDELDDDE